jgi:endonuclease YncB( thermonuclease family)
MPLQADNQNIRTHGKINGNFWVKMPSEDLKLTFILAFLEMNFVDASTFEMLEKKLSELKNKEVNQIVEIFKERLFVVFPIELSEFKSILVKHIDAFYQTVSNRNTPIIDVIKKFPLHIYLQDESKKIPDYKDSMQEEYEKNTFYGEVIQIISGDTLLVLDDGKKTKRKVKIDWIQAIDGLSKEYITKHFADNKYFAAFTINDTDKNGVVICDIGLNTIGNMNLQMIAAGYAKVDINNKNKDVVKMLLNFQEQAKSKKLGVWK